VREFVNAHYKGVVIFVCVLAVLFVGAAGAAAGYRGKYRQQLADAGRVVGEYAGYRADAEARIRELTEAAERGGRIIDEASGIVGGLAERSEQNIRSLQDAIALVKKIRADVAGLVGLLGRGNDGGGD
jgi:hypothetical protein